MFESSFENNRRVVFDLGDGCHSGFLHLLFILSCNDRIGQQDGAKKVKPFDFPRAPKIASKVISKWWHQSILRFREK
jgi:hypothetical protein